MTRALKYAADRVTGALLLLLLSPVLLGIALWIVADSGRPALIRQQRAGKNGKPFGMFKFRTMVRNAVEEARKMQLADPFGVVKDDPRITNPGRILRRTGLDELPQLLNVVIGQMSLVGPRPDLVEQAANYTDSDRRRLAVLPGITGWSQVQGREEIPWPERIALDIWYIEHWSLRLDLKIVLLTVGQFGRDEPEPVEDTMNIDRARASESGEAAKR
jgi:sugar transferase EpsL